MSRLRHLGMVFRVLVLVTLVAGGYLYRHEIAEAASHIADLDAIVVLVLPLFVLWNYLASHAWVALHRSLAAESAPSAWRLSLIRLQAQALNLVVPLASVGGEVLRATMLSRYSGQMAASASAVVLDKIADAAAGVAFSLLGIMIGFAALRDGLLLALVLGALLVGVIAFLPIALRLFGRRIASSGSGVARALAPIVREPRRVTLAFYKAMGWHGIERMLTGVEIYLAMVAAGLSVSFGDAIFVSAVMTAYTLVFFFIPGQMGAAEAGVVSAFTSLGLSPTLGLTVALVRRARQLLIIAAGALIFLLSDQGRPRERAGETGEP